MEQEDKSKKRKKKKKIEEINEEINTTENKINENKPLKDGDKKSEERKPEDIILFYEDKSVYSYPCLQDRKRPGKAFRARLEPARQIRP